jgi:hypothetical protein
VMAGPRSDYRSYDRTRTYTHLARMYRLTPMELLLIEIAYNFKATEPCTNVITRNIRFLA